jgi:hypothetical protein
VLTHLHELPLRQSIDPLLLEPDFAALGVSRPTMCLSMTLLPLPLAPMMTRQRPASTFSGHTIEHDQASEALVKILELDDGHGLAEQRPHPEQRVDTFPWRAGAKKKFRMMIAMKLVTKLSAGRARTPRAHRRRSESLPAGNQPNGAAKKAAFDDPFEHLPGIHTLRRVEPVRTGGNMEHFYRDQPSRRSHPEGHCRW